MDEKLSATVDENEGEEQLKIKTVISNLQVKDHLDKDQLHEAFFSAGLEEVNDTVRKGNERDHKFNLSVAAD